jgi:hypothetical protein
MKKNYVFSILTALFLAAVLVLASCETFEEEDEFVAVTRIDDIPLTGTTLIPRTLSGTVMPRNATNQIIIWQLDGTNPTLTPPSNNSFTALSPGKVTGTAIIPNGLPKGKPYTQPFEITISNKFVAVNSIDGISSTGTVGIPFPLEVSVNPVDATDKEITWTITGNGADAAINENSTTLSAKKAGVVMLRAAIANGNGVGDPFSTVFSINFNYTPVTGIKGVPTSGLIDTEIKLKDLTVEPENATSKVITWEVVTSGNTDAEINNGILTAKKKGTVKVKATVADGEAVGKPFTRDYDISISDEIIPVTDIIRGIPETAPVGELKLEVTVTPNTATNQTIKWTVTPTDAFISKDTLTTTTAGNFTLKATIEDGKGKGDDFTKEFPITILTAAEYICKELGGNALVISNGGTSGLVLYDRNYRVDKSITIPDSIELYITGEEVAFNITSDLTVEGRLVIGDGNTLKVIGGGSLNLNGESAVTRPSGKLEINNATVNIKNELDVQGILKIEGNKGKVSVLENGILTISNGPDDEGTTIWHKQSDCGWDFNKDNKGKISGDGTVEVQSGGTMRMPNPASNPDTFNLKGVGGKIVINAGGNFHLLGIMIKLDDGTKFSHVEWPLIRGDDITTYNPPKIKWIGVEYLVTKGSIEITVEKNLPVLTLIGEANALGVRSAPSPSAFTRYGIELQHRFTVDRTSVLTIGKSATDITTYRVMKYNVSTGSIDEGDYEPEVTDGTLINNGIIIINNNSALEEQLRGEDAVKGTGIIFDSARKTITPSYDGKDPPEIKKWEGKKP